MRALTLTCTALLCGLLAGGCSFGGRLDPSGALDEASEAQAAEEGSLLDRMADRIVAAGTPEERALRICFFATVAAEVYVYRLRYFGAEPGELEAAFGSVARLESAVARLQAQERTLWFETEMFYVVVDILRAVEGPARDRALGLASRVATFDWRGIARGLRTAGGQALLADRMFADANAAAEAMKAGKVTLEEGWTACRERLAEKRGQLAATIGIAAPPQLRLGGGSSAGAAPP